MTSTQQFFPDSTVLSPFNTSTGKFIFASYRNDEHLIKISSPYSGNVLNEEEDDTLLEVFGALLDEDEEDDSHVSDVHVKSEDGSHDKKKGKNQPKKRKLNPDADAIATVTEEALRELELDPESEDAKKKRRQIRNRLSAQFHRDRKNAYIKSLEETLETKEKEIASLKEELNRVLSENSILRQSMSMVTMGYFNSDSSVTSGHTSYQANTDSESSVCHTPSYSESPVHNPSSQLFNECVPLAQPFVTATMPAASSSTTASTTILPTVAINDINMQHQAYPTIFSGPLLKSLSVLSILCLICLTGLGPLSGVQNDVGDMVTLVPIGISDPVKLGETAESLVALNPHHHRRLEEIQQQLPALLPSHFTLSPSSHNLTIPTTVNAAHDQLKPKQHLRKGDKLSEKNDNVSVSSSDSPSTYHRAVYVSKDMVHMDFQHAFQSGWVHKSGGNDYQSLSHIVMKNGFALFDPSMRLGNEYTNNVAKVFPVVPTVEAGDFNAIKTIENVPIKTFHSNALVPAPPNSVALNEVMDNQEELHANNKLAINRWPAITAGPGFVKTADSSLNEDTFSSSCDGERQALLSQFLSKANRVTVTLPASSVRMGKTLSDSTDSTVESIMQMFNLTSLNDEDDKLLLRNTSVDASVEINCIILGAKLVLSSPSK